MKKTSVIVVGAGAAGIAAAAALVDAGLEPIVIEARDRIGGRVFTRRVAAFPSPIELGAEFIHGEARITHQIAEAHGVAAIDIAGERRFIASPGKLSPIRDYWERLDRVMRRLDPDRDVDRSFKDALAAHRRSLSARDRMLATQFIEGFDAADTTVVSEKSLAAAGSPCANIREMRIGRPYGGYHSLLATLARDVRSRICLSTTVTMVTWQKGRVEVACHDRGGATLDTRVARAAVITVPVGVLAAAAGSVGAIAIDPPVPSVGRAISDLAMGSVVKLVIQMKRAFWLDRAFADRLGAPQVDGASFFHARDTTTFPVWWTQYPVRAPLLVAWRGGPGAVPLARLSTAELEARAVDSLASVFSMKPALVRREVVATFHHDWSSDPFARGAYAYARVGGHTAHDRLSAPVDDTLWFAGEATAAGGGSGTVDGAIASGRRAAREIVRVLA